MTPFYRDEWLTILEGDCRAVLPSLPADSVDCVVTSPPYWGLRDYGHTGQLGLERTPEEYVANMVAVFAEVRRVLKPSGTCWLNLGDSYASGGGSGAQRLDELGERLGTGGGKKHSSRPSGRAPSAGLAHKQLVGIPWRVAFALQADGWYLRSDIIWSKPNPMPESVTDRPTKSHETIFLLTKSARYYFDADAVREDRDPKQIEWREKYAKTISEWGQRRETGVADSPRRGGNSGLATQPNSVGRNIRSVWTIATRPYPGAHFAVFPPELPERCIKAGSSEKGVCPECGAPWERVVRPTDEYAAQSTRPGLHDLDRDMFRLFLIGARRARKLSKAQVDAAMGTNGAVAWWEGRNYLGKFTQQVPMWDLYQRLKGVLELDDRFDAQVRRVDQHSAFRNHAGRIGEGGPPAESYVAPAKRITTGRVQSTVQWRATCAHTAEPEPAVILDPFAGSGTVGLVANRLSRRAILIDLNPEYLKQQMTRNAQTPLGLGAA